jgi:hypothetical protein
LPARVQARAVVALVDGDSVLYDEGTRIVRAKAQVE